eukprot:CAMPEP_0175153438 /NCGR_PEP_ID=MMETSP0087-20121206/19739_1 /TAXON_ID=136419 /ORGANISM="Unknown Unknown, Strain D1" /LENGTH=640 /DNA_ID=CAMNT_0016440121 /DNA_START=76 /DNA_END=1995 /DNA_ORIENTATION=+
MACAIVTQVSCLQFANHFARVLRTAPTTGSAITTNANATLGGKGTGVKSKGATSPVPTGACPIRTHLTAQLALTAPWGGRAKLVLPGDPSVLPELPKALLGVINDHHTFVTQQAKLNPLPGPVGWGVDAFAGTLIKLPVIELSYTDTSKVWGGYRLPVEAVFTPYQVPAGTGQTYVFPGIEDYEGLRTTFGSQNMGRQGIFTEGRADVWDSIWKSNSHDQSLTVTQWEYDVYSVDLPVDPVTRRFEFVLSKFTNRAINMLPPEYNENTAEIFDFFFENYGTSFAKTSKNGGLLEQRSVWTSWLTTQRAESTTPGGAPPSFTLNDIAEQAQNVLYNSTGRSDPGWHHSTVDPDYANASHVIGTQCFGGDPLEACGSAAWIATLPKYPASSQWVTGAMDQLVADPVVSAAVKAAIDTYIAKQKAAWAATSLCPANCGAGGVCDPTSRANKCSCPANIMGRMCSACVYGWTGYTATNACQKPVCAPVTAKTVVPTAVPVPGLGSAHALPIPQGRGASPAPAVGLARIARTLPAGLPAKQGSRKMMAARFVLGPTSVFQSVSVSTKASTATGLSAKATTRWLPHQGPALTIAHPDSIASSAVQDNANLEATSLRLTVAVELGHTLVTRTQPIPDRCAVKVGHHW